MTTVIISFLSIEEEEAVAILVLPNVKIYFQHFRVSNVFHSLHRPVGTRGIFLSPVLTRTKMPPLPCYSYSLGNNKYNSKLNFLFLLSQE